MKLRFWNKSAVSKERLKEYERGLALVQVNTTVPLLEQQVLISYWDGSTTTEYLREKAQDGWMYGGAGETRTLLSLEELRTRLTIAFKDEMPYSFGEGEYYVAVSLKNVKTIYFDYENQYGTDEVVQFVKEEDI